MIKFPVTLEIDINSNCNLYCSYCRNNAVNTREVIKNDLSTDEILNIITECKDKLFKLIISGGEPTIHPDFRKIITYIHECRIRWTLISNGYNIDSEYADYLKKCDVDSVYITLSGMTDETDGLYKGVSDSFTSVVNAIEKLISSGVKINLGYLLTPQGAKELDILDDFLYKYAINNCKISNVVPIGRAENKDFYYSINENKLKKLKIHHKERISFTEDMLNPAEIDCQAGVLSCVITANGDVIPCASFINQGVSAGNIKFNTLHEIWNNSELFINLRKKIRIDAYNSCRLCKNKSSCRKGCRALGYLKTGIVNSIDGRCLK